MYLIPRRPASAISAGPKGRIPHLPPADIYLRLQEPYTAAFATQESPAMGKSMGQRLTSEQNAIVKDIRRLHRQREPLNITAVKRRHPRLLEAAYRMKPFWGWKRAIEAAGLRYSDIHKRLEDEVVCRICGGRRESIAGHLRKDHSCSGEEYYRDYPGAEIMAETMRARMFGRWRGRSYRSLVLMPHWEPLWSGEYVLDRVASLHARGIPVSFQFLHATEASLLAAGAKYFGSWTWVLKRVGLDPEEVVASAPRDTWAVRGIERRRSDFPCKFTRADRECLLREVRRVAAIEDEEKREVDIRRLRSRFRGHAMYFYSGMWGRIADAAGVPPQRIRGKAWKYLSREDVIAEIRARHERGLDLKSHVTEKGRHADGALYYRV